jgi:DNA-binding transcriptional MocR family regulator
VSNSLLTAAFNSDVPQPDRAVLLVIANAINEQKPGNGWHLSYEEMSGASGFDRRTVLRCVKRLEAAGLLSVERRDRRVSCYRINEGRLIERERPKRKRKSSDTQSLDAPEAPRAASDTQTLASDRESPELVTHSHPLPEVTELNPTPRARASANHGTNGGGNPDLQKIRQTRIPDFNDQKGLDLLARQWGVTCSAYESYGDLRNRLFAHKAALLQRAA